MRQQILRGIHSIQFDRYEGYKVFISLIFGLLGFLGTFCSIQFHYADVNINITWSLIFPLLVAMSWGKRYGCISIFLGLPVLYPFYVGGYNGWACFVPAFSLYLWIIILGYGAEKRNQQVKTFYNNTYFLQFIYIITRVTLYFTAFPFLYRFNPPFWHLDAYTTIEYKVIILLAIKSVVFDTILLAVSDVLLLLPFIRKIFRLECSIASRYNTLIVLGVTFTGFLFALIILTFDFYIIDERYSFQWLLHPSTRVLMTFFLVSLFCSIFGGILARIFQWFLETKEILKGSERKFRGIYENIYDLYSEVTIDGTILAISPSIKEVLGYEADDLIKGNCGELYVNPSQRQEVVNAILLYKEVKNYEIILRDKDGCPHHLWLHARIAEHNSGQKKIIGVTRDVTPYMKAKEKQEESEKNYKLLFDKMLNGFFVFEPVFDDYGNLQDIRFIDVNPAFEKLSAKKAIEMIGKTWFEIYGIKNRYLEVYEQLFLTGLPQSFQAYNSDLNHQHYLANAFMINEKNAGVIINCNTESVKVKEELERMNANLEAIIESTDDLIWLVDRDHKTILCNSSFTTHMKKYLDVEIIQGIRAEDIFTKDHIIMWKSHYERVFREGSYSIEWVTPRSKICFDISFSPIYKDGEIYAISCFAKDITQRKLAEKEIHKLNAELERRVVERTAELQMAVNELESFTYTVSHDLKSPLRAIDAYSRIMLEDYPEQMEGETGEITGYIKNISRDMIALINKLLQYSTTSRLDIYKENVAINEMIRLIFDELTSALHERQIKLVFETELPNVHADKILLKQVVYNVISNAIKFTKTRELATVKVGHTIDKMEFVFYVKDNGVGFDRKGSEKLFGIFQRLHSVEEYEGTGIGLATVRKIMQKHGGRTWIEGKMDQGATVYFTLPFM